MSLEKVREHFKQYGMEGRIIEFAQSSATVQEAAKAAGTEPGQIAKTMSFHVAEKPVLILMAGDVKVDNHKYKEYFHTKARMLTPEELPEEIGHVMGGVCPFGIKDGVTVYLDNSLKRFETVFPAAGSGNSAIELTIEELERTSGYTEWIDVTKPIE
ncbi:MAG: YbaK/EbsC family protein [Eubacteriales bacterium]|nr:YbaK/EbsC family protein [Eubacteriales bacterium]